MNKPVFCYDTKTVVFKESNILVLVEATRDKIELTELIGIRWELKSFFLEYPLFFKAGKFQPRERIFHFYVLAYY